MRGLETRTPVELERRETRREAAVCLDDFTYCVETIGGEVLEVAPATAIRLTQEEFIFLLGEAIVARLPREQVYFVTRKLTAPPGQC